MVHRKAPRRDACVVRSTGKGAWGKVCAVMSVSVMSVSVRCASVMSACKVQ